MNTTNLGKNKKKRPKYRGLIQSKRIRNRIEKWCKALESGKYRQTRTGWIYTRGTETFYPADGLYRIVNPGKSEDLWSAPAPMRSMKGLPYNDFRDYVVSMNDNGKKSFAYIANRARKHLLGQKVKRLV